MFHSLDRNNDGMGTLNTNTNFSVTSYLLFSCEVSTPSVLSYRSNWCWRDPALTAPAWSGGHHGAGFQNTAEVQWVCVFPWMLCLGSRRGQVSWKLACFGVSEGLEAFKDPTYPLFTYTGVLTWLDCVLTVWVHTDQHLSDPLVVLLYHLGWMRLDLYQS